MKKRSPIWLVVLSSLTKSCHLDCTKYVRSVAKAPRHTKAKFAARKYRDEPRPRQGLLRTKEFIMKDLYTFDATTKQALQTYHTVRQAYNAFFSEFKIPYLTAEASSGEIGGDLSHEYHFPSKKGEDNLVCCSSCDYVVNEELAESRIARAHRNPKSAGEDVAAAQGLDCSNWKQWNSEPGPPGLEAYLNAKVGSQASEDGKQWLGISQDRGTLVYASLPREVEIQAVAGKRYRKTEINPYAIKRIFPDLDLGVEDPLRMFKAERVPGAAEKRSQREARILRVVDMRYVLQQPPSTSPRPSSIHIGGVEVPVEYSFAEADKMVDLVRIDTGDLCPNCDEGTLRIESAVELGHTFHLGARYSTPLEATIEADLSQKDLQREGSSVPGRTVTLADRIPVEMGCHGIGVSRLIAAVADSLADSKGLNWPRVMAPFEAIIIPTKGWESEAVAVYDLLATNSDHRPQGLIDAILDDRKRDFGWKMNDADMIGYPVIVILGRGWKRNRECEVQCRRLGVKESVSTDNLKEFIEGLLQQL